jgi:glycerate 2-kinase
MTDAKATLRADLTRIFMAGVAAADPVAAVERALCDRPLPVPKGGRLILLAIGKAAHGMLKAARLHVADGVVPLCLAVTNYENHIELAGVQCFAAGHPVPDENGLRAGAAVARIVADAGADDHIVALISGGGSALLPAPADGITLHDKAAVNRLLLASGADIEDTNIVRQALSALKGGGLLRLAAPAAMRSLILSDVVGDDLRVIASGPTIAPISDRAAARTVLAQLGGWDQIPQAAKTVLLCDLPQAPLPGADATLIGSNAISVAAMAAAAKGDFVMAEAPLTGPVTQAAHEVLDAARKARPGAGLLFGGETTVLLTGDGRGGRNQELALRVALLAEEQEFDDDWMFLSAGTDGRDGPTDAAGAIVDQTTLARVRAAGADPVALLANSDSYAALAASNELLMTGATGTNVADLQIFLKL